MIWSREHSQQKPLLRILKGVLKNEQQDGKGQTHSKDWLHLVHEIDSPTENVAVTKQVLRNGGEMKDQGNAARSADGLDSIKRPHDMRERRSLVNEVLFHPQSNRLGMQRSGPEREKAGRVMK